MLGPVTCAACGAKVREDRIKCLRCGASLAAARASRRAERRWFTLGVMAACVMLGVFAAALIARSATRPEPGAAPASSSVQPAITRPVAAQSAPAVARTASTAVPASAVDRTRDGVMAFGRGDVAGSINEFRTAVEAAPNNAVALNNLAQALVKDKRTVEAIPYFDRAIGIAPSVWSYRFNRARAFGLLEQWPRAIADYQEAAALFPDDYATQFNLARAQQASGDLPAAIATYRKAIALAPGQPEFHLSLANALETAGQSKEAATVYRRYLELEPSGPQAEKIRQRVESLSCATCSS